MRVLIGGVLLLGGILVSSCTTEFWGLETTDLRYVLVLCLTLTPVSLYAEYIHFKKCSGYVPLVLWLTFLFTWGSWKIIDAFAFNNLISFFKEQRWFHEIMVPGVCFFVAILTAQIVSKWFRRKEEKQEVD